MMNDTLLDDHSIVFLLVIKMLIHKKSVTILRSFVSVTNPAIKCHFYVNRVLLGYWPLWNRWRLCILEYVIQVRYQNTPCQHINCKHQNYMNISFSIWFYFSRTRGTIWRYRPLCWGSVQQYSSRWFDKLPGCMCCKY